MLGALRERCARIRAFFRTSDLDRDFEEELKSVLTKAEELRRELTKIIEEDIEAFDAVMRAYGMPRLTKDESTTRAQAIQAALKKATSVPMRCCRACREVITIGGVVAEKGNRDVALVKTFKAELRSAAYAAWAATPASLIAFPMVRLHRPPFRRSTVSI